MAMLDEFGFEVGDVVPDEFYIVREFPSWFNDAIRSRYGHCFKIGSTVYPASIGTKPKGLVLNYLGQYVALFGDYITREKRLLPLCCVETDLVPFNRSKNKLPKGI